MTTIAFDGKVMAGDTKWCEDELQIVSRSKIERLPNGCLYGSSGSSEDREVKALLKRVKRPAQLPAFAELSKIRVDCRALLVFPDGKAYQIDTSHKQPENAKSDVGVLQVETPCAIGTGRAVALGAMDYGASAFEAVKIACGRDIHSGEPVTRLTLNPRSSFKRPKP